MLRTCAILELLILFALDPLDAASSSPKPAPSQPLGQRALEHYHKGLEHQQRAWDYEERAAAATKEKDRRKHLKKARKEFDKAIAQQQSAVKVNPRLHEAFSSLGYAYRKIGDYTRSLTAYDQALSLAPEYAEAIEYRAEAYLGLNRVADAQQAYEWLFLHDPEKAGTLLVAATEWIQERRENSMDITVEVIEAMEAWVLAKETTASELTDEHEKASEW